MHIRIVASHLIHSEIYNTNTPTHGHITKIFCGPYSWEERHKRKNFGILELLLCACKTFNDFFATSGRPGLISSEDLA